MTLFARLVKGDGRPEMIEAWVKYARETNLPACKKMGGFKGAYVLVDRSTGRGIGISFWDSETAMKASEDAAAQLRSQGTQALGGTIVSVERYEVVAQA